MGKAQWVLLVSQTALRGLLGNEEFEVAGRSWKARSHLEMGSRKSRYVYAVCK